MGKTFHKKLNKIASQRSKLLQVLHDNGIDCTPIITTIIEEKNLSMINYIVANICNENNCFMFFDAGNPSLHHSLDEMISKRIDKDRLYIVEFDRLMFVIEQDLDKILKSMLNALLRREDIEDIDNYHPNGLVTFEFVFNLLLLCVKHHGHNDGFVYSNKCMIVLRLLLDKITKFNHEYSIKYHHCYTNDTNLRTMHNECISCLKQETIDTNDEILLGFVYCNLCDYYICQTCFNNKNGNSANVNLSPVLL